METERNRLLQESAKLGSHVIITGMPMKKPHDGRIARDNKCGWKIMEILQQRTDTTIHPIVVSTSGGDRAASGLLDMLLPPRRSLVSQ